MCRFAAGSYSNADIWCKGHVWLQLWWGGAAVLEGGGQIRIMMCCSDHRGQTCRNQHMRACGTWPLGKKLHVCLFMFAYILHVTTDVFSYLSQCVWLPCLWRSSPVPQVFSVRSPVSHTCGSSLTQPSYFCFHTCFSSPISVWAYKQRAAVFAGCQIVCKFLPQLVGLPIHPSKLSSPTCFIASNSNFASLVSEEKPCLQTYYGQIIIWRMTRISEETLGMGTCDNWGVKWRYKYAIFIPLIKNALSSEVNSESKVW